MNAETHSLLSPTPAGLARPWRRGFWSLFVTQFQGAFNDNAFKFLVTFMVMGLGFSPKQRDELTPVVGAVFALPFILFSMSGGYLSDRYSKRSVAVGTKVAEVFILLLGLAGLALNNIPILITAIFLLSTQSAFFGPAKYGLLPEMLPEKRLSWGNGVLSLGTFLAIISGTVVAGLLSELFQGRQVWSGAVLLGLSVLGVISSLGINRVPPADVTRRFQLNVVPEFLRHWRMIRCDRVLFLAILGAAYFWFLAAILQLTILFYGKETLGLGDAQISYLMAAVAVGIGVGSCTAGYLSGQKIEYGLVPLGAIGLTLLSGALAFPGFDFRSVLVVLALLGFFGGFFIVPLNALVQHRPEPSHKGSVIATLAVLSFSGVFLASWVYYGLRLGLGLSLPQVFLFCSALTLAGAVYVVWLLPDSLLRLVLWFLTHSLYRITVEGRDQIPERGGALLVSNHLSLVDALLLLASTDRRLRFVILKEMYELPWIKPFARIMRAIPISPKSPPRELMKSLETARTAIREGETVCIFAEGQMTRTGQMMPFRRGLEWIMKDVDAPIVPVSLDGVWGSVFSFADGRFLWKWPRRIPYPVTVSYGQPMPGQAPVLEVRQRVQELNTQAWQQRKRRMQTVHQAFIRTARTHGRRLAMADAGVARLRFGSALAKVVFLARRLRKIWQGQEMVGLLLPPSVPGALVNWAALLSGKIPVNLNYTLSEEAIRSCLAQCRIQSVLSSGAFLKRLPLKIPGQVLLLEECVAGAGLGEKCAAWLLARFCPAGWLEKILSGGKKARVDDVATVIFSSGSTGDPKGVMLSHFNLGSNVVQLGQAFSMELLERILGVLPFFHSFGFTGTLCLPAMLGVGVVYHPNPLEARPIGQLIDQHRISCLLATPTFLQIYLRGCDPDQLGGLRLVIVGAEKLPERVAVAFEDRFGIRPLEAYGCTECAPAVTVNAPDFRAPGLRQVGAKRGTIGHPLPGVSIRIVDPTTLAPLGPNQPGLLLVRGPNVMLGYLNRPEQTAEVLQDGWYRTADIAAMDEDGFLTITDRMSRFSKIGGEMVPHIKVEEHLHELAGLTELSFVVTGVPDERKGECLVVLHNLPEPALGAVLDKLTRSSLPNLWKPRPDQFLHVNEFPLLGSGKLDLRRVRELAGHFSSQSIADHRPAQNT